MARRKKSPKKREGREELFPVEAAPAESVADDSEFVTDFVSDVPVRATPEEVEAVQVFAQKLVNDLGYPKDVLQTRPQLYIRRRPSERDARGWPVDIAVFRDSAKHIDDLYMVVECKRKTRKDGLAQLKKYFDLSGAEIGVWFNGENHAYLRKRILERGRRKYEEIRTLPRHGESLDDVGKFRRRDLVPPSNLKAVFRDLRNHLAINATGMTRDESLAQEIINLLFCKIYDEINTAPDDLVAFRCGTSDSDTEVKRRIVELFEKSVKTEYADVFDRRDAIGLDARSVAYVVGELQHYSVVAANRDAVGDAFEVFIGPALRGSEGQFFTPRNVVRMIVGILDPQPEEMLLDPACGSGGFLIMALEHVWAEVEREGARKGWDPVRVDRRKRDVATRFFRGIDKDSFLAKVTKAYMAIIGDGRGGVFCENTLAPSTSWHSQARDKIGLASFDVVVTNPPFGSKIKVTGEEILSQYDFGHKWQTPRKVRGEIQRMSELADDRPPQLLFLERCLQLLKPGGRLGIVMPESILGNPSYEFVVKYVMDNATIEAVITMPEALFKTSGKGGTHTKVAVLVIRKSRSQKGSEVFMADVKWCGHDSRGNPTIQTGPDGSERLLDEVPDVVTRYFELQRGLKVERDHIGYLLPLSDLRNRILVPKYYNPELERRIGVLRGTHDLIEVRELVDAGDLSIETGIEVGKMAYGTGRIPFIRTSDLSNWEIKADFKHGVSEAIYREESRKESAQVQPGDILMVRDGTYLIGTTAMVTEHDVPMLYQSHLYRIRVEDSSRLDRWLLLACLNSPVVRRQVRSKQFTQDIIDTLGRRLLEIVLPIPKRNSVRRQISQETQNIVETRVRLREEAKRMALEVEGKADESSLDEEEAEELTVI